MSKHFTKGAKTIGISSWFNKEGKIPELEKACIIHNSQFFDEFYLVSNLDEDFFDSSITRIKVGDFSEELGKIYYEGVYYKPNEFSDLLRVSACEILNVDKVMAVDTDEWLYNQFLIKEVFEESILSIFSWCKNYYLKYIPETLEDPTEMERYQYLNMAVVFQTRRDPILANIKKALISTVTEGVNRYTDTGPGLLGRFRTTFDKSIRRTYQNKIKACDLDMRTLGEGVTQIEKSPFAFGCHLCASFLEELGYTLLEVKDSGNKIEIRLERC